MKTTSRKNSILLLGQRKERIRKHLRVNVVMEKKEWLKEFGCRTVIMACARNVFRVIVERN